MALYFIALIPNPEIREKVRLLKEEMSERFQARHALKSPAHLTLQMPFKRPEEEEEATIGHLKDFAGRQEPLRVVLDGFDCFPPRVIYIKVSDHEPLIRLHSRLQSHLVRCMGFRSDEVQSRFHPHVTIATRDLRKAAFREAWTEFESRPFVDSFCVSSLFLLKHNGRFWDIYREFGYGG